MENEIMDVEETIEDTSTELEMIEDTNCEETVEASSQIPGMLAGAVFGIAAVKGIPALVEIGKKAYNGAKEKVTAFVAEKKKAKEESSKDDHVVIEEAKTDEK